MATINRDQAGSDGLRRMLAELASKQVRVGFLETSKYPDGTPVAYVATIQEFHPQHARPFMRPTIEEQRSAWQASLKQGMQAVLDAQLDATTMLQQFGMRAAGDVRLTISRIHTPALAPATLAARQRRRSTPGVSAKPLVDTGLLIQSVNSDVVDR